MRHSNCVLPPVPPAVSFCTVGADLPSVPPASFWHSLSLCLIELVLLIIQQRHETCKHAKQFFDLTTQNNFAWLLTHICKLATIVV